MVGLGIVIGARVVIPYSEIEAVELSCKVVEEMGQRYLGCGGS